MANEYFGIKPINFDDISIHGGVTGDTYLHSGGSLTSNLNTKFTISDLFDYWETTSAIWQIGVSGVELVAAGDVFLDGNLDVTSLGTSDFLFSSGNTITGGSFASVNLSSFNNDLVDNNDIDYVSTVSYDGINGEIDFIGVGNAFSGAINLGAIPLSDFNNDLIDNNDIDYISNVSYNGVGGSLDFTGLGNAFNANIDLSLIPLSDFNNDIAAGGTQNLTWTSGTSTLSISDGNSQVINTFGSLSISGFGNTDFLYSNLDTVTAGTWASVNLSSFNNDLVDANDIDYVSGISFNNVTGNFDVTGVGNGFSGSIDLSTFNLSHFNNDLTDLNDIDYISNVAYDGINGEIDFTGVGNGFTGSILLSAIPLSDFNNDLVDNNDIDYISTVAFNNTTGTLNFTGVGSAFTGNLDASVFNLSHFNNDLVDLNDIDYISLVSFNNTTGNIEFTGVGSAFNDNIDVSTFNLSHFNNDLVDNNDIDYVSTVAFNNTTGTLNFTGVGNAFTGNLDASVFNLSHFNNDLVDANDIDYISSVAYNGVGGTLDFTGIGNAFNSNIDLSLIPLSDFNNDLVDNNNIDYVSNVVFNNTTGNLEVTGIGSAFNSNIDLSTFNLSHFNNDLADANDIDYISNVSYNGVGGSIDFTGVGNGYNGALLLSGIPLSDFNNDLASELQNLTWTSGTNTLAISGGNSQVLDTFNILNITSIANADFLYTNTNAVTGGTWAGVNLSSFNDDVSLWESTGTYSISPKDAPGNNILIGVDVGDNITTASDNVFLGRNAGKLNTTASDNVFLGVGSGSSNTTGSQNYFAGALAGEANVDGARNIYMGYLSGRNSVSGDDNMGYGYLSLQGLTSSSQNIAIGREALYSTNGFFNVAIGSFAGRTTTGSSNVFIGTRAGQNSTGSNKLYIANSNTTTPLIYGEFDNSLARINGDLEVVSTGYVLTPVGTTLERPTGATGMVRFNSTDVNFEGYDGTSWVPFGSTAAPQTLSFINPNLTLSDGGGTVDISGVNYWTFDGIGNRYLLEDVYVGVNGGNVYSLRADLLTRLENLYLTGTLSDSTNSTGASGNVLTRSAGGGVEWADVGSNTSGNYSGNSTEYVIGGTNLAINGASTSVSIPSTGDYMIIASAVYSTTTNDAGVTFHLRVNGVNLHTANVTSGTADKSKSVSLHCSGSYTSGHAITIQASGTAGTAKVKLNFIKLIA